MNAPRKKSLSDLLAMAKELKEANTWTGYEAVRIPHFEEVVSALKVKTVDANDRKIEAATAQIEELEAQELSEKNQESLEEAKAKLQSLRDFNKGMLATLTHLKMIIQSGALQDGELATRTKMPKELREDIQPYFDEADAMMDAEVAAYHSQQESAKKVADEAIEKAQNGKQ